MVLFDRALRLRYPAEAAPREKPVELRGIAEREGWLVDSRAWGTELAPIARWDDFAGDRARAGWVPDAYTAAVWQAFVVEKPVVKIVSPPGLGDGAEFILHRPGEPIRLEAVVPEGTTSAELHAGDRRLGPLAIEGTRAAATLGDLEPGIHGLFVRITRDGAPPTCSAPSTILVGRK